ncbi:MAG: hypothetical protein Q4B99_04370 [Clostridia bacterium]|nr:hypothetical protein [Clostridia bacterium]
MKRYNRITRVLVDFDPNSGVRPAYFISASGSRQKVTRILAVDTARWGYRSYMRFVLEFDARRAELYWDRTRDTWLLVKEGAV